MTMLDAGTAAGDASLVFSQRMAYRREAHKFYTRYTKRILDVCLALAMLPVLVPLPRRNVRLSLSSLRVRSDSLRESAVDSGKKKKRSAAPVLSAPLCLVVFRPLTVLPCAGGHRQLYGKKLTDMMSVFEAIDRYQTTATTTAT